MTRATKLTIMMDEAVVSSKLLTEKIFDQDTVKSLQEILIVGTLHFVSHPEKGFKNIDKQTIQSFRKYVANKFNKIPNFVQYGVKFRLERGSLKLANYLFAEGYHIFHNPSIFIIVNDKFNGDEWEIAWNKKFLFDIYDLRGLVRHELSHRIEFEKNHPSPETKRSIRRSDKSNRPYKNSDPYYGQPTEIIAYANHIVEALANGYNDGWGSILQRFVNTDKSKNFKNTRRLIRAVAKLMKEYNISWLKRRLFKKKMMELARVIRAGALMDSETYDAIKKEVNSIMSK